MAVQLQLRSGTTAQHSTFIGAANEITVDTNKKTVVVHDGVTAGGFPLAKASDLENNLVQYLPLAYPKNTPPVGYLAMMGQSISQVAYPILYSLYGATLPDMRAYFIRGLDNGRGIDIGRAVLSVQDDEFETHNHTIPDVNVINSGSIGFQGTGYQFASKSTDSTGGTETRPKNIAFLYIVKAG